MENGFKYFDWLLSIDFLIGIILNWFLCGQSIYVGRLFVCLYQWDPPNQDASDLFFLFGKLLRRRGVSAWFHGVWTCSAKSSWILNDFSLKIKLNRSWKFRKNWNVPLMLLERSWWTRFNGIYLVRFGFRMWVLSDFYYWKFK